jgi:hypothetical protein
MTNGFTNEYIPSAIPSEIINKWPGHRPSLPLFLLFFPLQLNIHPTANNHPLKKNTLSHLNTTHYSLTFVVTTFVLWFIMDFFILVSKSIFFFYFNTILKCQFYYYWMFTCFIVFLSNKLVVWIYNFVLVMICFRFYKIIFVCKLLKFMSIYRLSVLWWNK